MVPLLSVGGEPVAVGGEGAGETEGGVIEGGGPAVGVFVGKTGTSLSERSVISSTS